ncbi:uncharacterized protein LOC124943548 [Impatiens glandulifera]|uniref:uncharacterized protein LOC124943548 n=1 Tax=Impatiens glandulifera TaxID=253017 RepID=UPI001FB097BD|nr:uncharacterized protein LOC124943548 [Impatiens glandulifera]
MKLGFIDGSCKMPLDADGVMQWKLVDAMVRNWIMNTMDQNLKIHFQNAVTAQQLWKDIRSTYEGNNGPRRFQLGKDISTIQQGTSDIVEHYSKVKLIWDETAHLKPARKCNCDRSDVVNCYGCKVVSEVAQDVEEAKLLQFLMGVNDSYEHVVDNMLASDPWPSVHKAFTILVNVETKRNISISKGEYTAMMVKEKTELNNKNQKIEGSLKLPAEKFKPFKNSICTHCGLKGHIKEGCCQHSKCGKFSIG